MIVIRTVLQCQFGKGGELAAEFSKAAAAMQAELGAHQRWRVMTDLSGTFDTVVQEVDAESLAQWEEVRVRLFQSKSFREAMGKMKGIVVSGHNEFWHIEGEG